MRRTLQFSAAMVTVPIHLPPTERQIVANRATAHKFVEYLQRHSQPTTSYMDMSKGLADNGVENWAMDTSALKRKYYEELATGCW